MDALGILNAVQSYVMASGLFERVNGHEPRNAPGNGLSAAIWVQRLEPVATQSGLAATSARLEFTIRIYSSATQEPADAIDPNLIAAVDALITAYSGDFDLGGLVECVDLLGMVGAPLSAQAGYLKQEADGKLFRVMDLTLPVLIADAWTQSA